MYTKNDQLENIIQDQYMLTLWTGKPPFVKTPIVSKLMTAIMTYSEVAKYRATVGMKLDKEGFRYLMGFLEISYTSLLAKVKFFTFEISIIEACHQERIMLLTCVMIHWRIHHDIIRMMGNLNTL